MDIGGGKRDRTADLLHAMQALSQLSYTPAGQSGRKKQTANELAVLYRADPMESLAEWTGLEPATPGVTGRYSNQLNYHSAWDEFDTVFRQYPSFIKLGVP
jgi:hypothetical protein